MSLDLKPYLPQSMKIDLWKDLLDVIADEVVNFITERIDPKKIIFDVDSLTSKDALLNIHNMMGSTPDFSLDDAVSNWRFETNSIGFKVRYKNTYLGYTYLFNTFPVSGSVFNLFYTQGLLVRAVSSNLAGSLDAHDFTTTFSFPAEPNFSIFTLGFTLDFTPPYTLDGSLVSLDRFFSKTSTKHLAVEIAPNYLTEENSELYLATPTMFGYLKNGVEYNRRAVEIPHCGVQLTAICDSSGYYDASDPGADYSVPEIQLNCSITDLYDPNASPDYFNTIKIGKGSQSLVHSINGGTYPTDLSDLASGRVIYTDTSTEVGHWRNYFTEFQANSVLLELLATGDGSTKAFSGSLNNSQISPFSVDITYASGSREFTIEDDGFGNLVGTDSVGTISYTTGEYSITMEKTHSVAEEIVGTGDSSSTNFYYDLVHTPIVPNTVVISVTISSTVFTVSDDGAGNLTEAGVASGTVNYLTGEVDITFTGPPDSGTTVDAAYDYTTTTIPNNSSLINAKYRTEGNIPITEAGLFNANGDLVAYATFPSIALGDHEGHIAIQFCIKSLPF